MRLTCYESSFQQFLALAERPADLVLVAYFEATFAWQFRLALNRTISSAL